MDDRERGQVIASAAEVYDEFFVPALFQAWAEPICDVAGVGLGDRVLDVACGTGVVTRAVAARVGRAGRVVGLDVNAAMLTVARRKAPNLDLRLGRAESLPFEDGTFDAVTCQFALMFFEDRPAALAEMHRVLRPGGRLAVSVWDAADRTPGYAAVIALLERLFGPRVADALRAPFVLGDPSVLRALLVKAGITDASIETRAGVARFPSVRAWMHTDVKGWTLADMLDDAQFERLLGEAEEALRPFVSPDGTVSFPAPAHLVRAEKKRIADL